MFDMLDVDGGGTLDVDEIKTALEALGLPANETEIKRQMNAVATTGEQIDELDFATFIEFMHGQVENTNNSSSKDKAGNVKLPFFPLDSCFSEKGKY